MSGPESLAPEEGEISGLRAHAMRVGCYAGHRYPDRPEWVEVEGERVDVDSVESEWREEERLGYVARLRDGRRILLYYVPYHDLWSGVLLA